ncbi:MAG TPA: CAP domain-containing protein [Phycisphaerae bacterium]|nr:CAP domain-containing protein [Phycisphaerae bacterium]
MTFKPNPQNRTLLLPLLLPLLLAATTAPATKPADLYTMPENQFLRLPALQSRITADSVDLPLLDAAIFHRTNQERLAHNLPPFKFSGILHDVAQGHSREMAALHYFDHVSPTPENATMDQRFKNNGLQPHLEGENIAVLPAREMGSGEYIVTGNPPNEIYTDKQTHKVINYYAYAELADAFLTQWMNSPPHRAAILNPKFLYLAPAAARGDYQNQDSFYATQNFASDLTPDPAPRH